MTQMRVWATPDHDVPLVDALGRTVMGAPSVGKKADGSIIPEGVLVSTDAYYQRRLERGALLASAPQAAVSTKK